MTVIDEVKHKLKSIRTAAKMKADECGAQIIKLRELGSDDELAYEVTLSMKDNDHASITVRRKGPLRDVIREAERQYKRRYATLSFFMLYEVNVRLSDDIVLPVCEEHWREFRTAPKKSKY